MAKLVLKGVLHLWSETGTEGGFWAFQDEKFISLVAPPYGLWGGQKVWDASRPERQGTAEEGAEILRNGEWIPLRDPLTEDPDYAISSLFRGEQRGDHEADKRLMEKYGFRIKYFAERMNERCGEGNWHLDLEDSMTAILADGSRICFGSTPTTEPHRPYGVGPGDLTRVTISWGDGTTELRLSSSLLVSGWSYKGLHVLETGDILVIYSPEDPEEIVWSGTVKLIEHKLFTEDAFGYWIHADQKDVDRETWARYFLDEYPAKLVPVRTLLKKLRGAILGFFGQRPNYIG